MKKFVAFCLSTLLIVLSICSVSAITYGDADQDGSVGIMDATTIQLFIAQRVDLDENAKDAADVDGDGSISIMDCTSIQQFMACIIDKFPVEQLTEEPSIEISTGSGFSPNTPTVSPEPSTEPQTQEPTQYVEPNEYDLEVLRLVNIEREKEGLKPLQFGYFYFECAQTRANECASFDSCSHTRPDGSDWHTVFEDLKISAKPVVGENIAWGQETPQEVMTDWMNSPGHKANILYPDFEYIAIASVECIEQPGTFATVQLFWGEP